MKMVAYNEGESALIPYEGMMSNQVSSVDFYPLISLILGNISLGLEEDFKFFLFSKGSVFVCMIFSGGGSHFLMMSHKGVLVLLLFEGFSFSYLQETTKGLKSVFSSQLVFSMYKEEPLFWMPFVFKTSPKSSDFDNPLLKMYCHGVFSGKPSFTYNVWSGKELKMKHTFFEGYYNMVPSSKFSLVEGLLDLEVEDEDVEDDSLFSKILSNHVLGFKECLGFSYSSFFESDFVSHEEKNSYFFFINLLSYTPDFFSIYDKVELDDYLEEKSPYSIKFSSSSFDGNFKVGCMYPSLMYSDIVESFSVEFYSHKSFGVTDSWGAPLSNYSLFFSSGFFYPEAYVPQSEVSNMDHQGDLLMLCLNPNGVIPGLEGSFSPFFFYLFKTFNLILGPVFKSMSFTGSLFLNGSSSEESKGKQKMQGNLSFYEEVEEKVSGKTTEQNFNQQWNWLSFEETQETSITKMGNSGEGMWDTLMSESMSSLNVWGFSEWVDVNPGYSPFKTSLALEGGNFVSPYKDSVLFDTEDPVISSAYDLKLASSLFLSQGVFNVNTYLEEENLGNLKLEMFLSGYNKMLPKSTSLKGSKKDFDLFSSKAFEF